ncbi:hypothetical protein DPEC_G00311130 [Dallia pectoralis]|uniref:Uncharacterized protein n=1 Tax=Dallia pectoralis TaxID=75939 RepID=A0ACC2FBE1_DALPE|nr:hypothetical protein DPEC_G00311130 [Dallia pectoralis]
MKGHGLSVRQTYSDITDKDLRRLVSDYLVNSPNTGYRITSGFLRSQGLRLQQNRIRGALRAVDPIGTVLRGLEVSTIPRRPYSVPAPLSLWHIDGNHKLTRWRIVIHGGTDGFSRTIVINLNICLNWPLQCSHALCKLYNVLVCRNEYGVTKEWKTLMLQGSCLNIQTEDQIRRWPQKLILNVHVQ